MRPIRAFLLTCLLAWALEAEASGIKGIHVALHRVRGGETADSLIKRYGTTRGTLESLNPGLDLDRLAAGSRVRILSRPGIFQKLQAGLTVSDLVLAYQVDRDELLRINGISDPRKIYAGHELFIPDRGPLPRAKRAWLMRQRKLRKSTRVPRGILGKPLGTRTRLVISDGYGSRRHPITGRRQSHRAIDLVAPWGTPITAARAGVVVFAGWRGGYGKLVILKHDKGYETRYAHATDIVVRKGDKVSAGQIIGRVGATGDVTAPHLHFEIRQWGAPKNPTKYLTGFLR